jgi:hypothetical protein
VTESYIDYWDPLHDLRAEQTYAARQDDPDYWFELANRHDIEAAEEWAHRQERGRR